MSEDNDEEVTELDIVSRTWNKLKTTMKLFGFREGAVEGKNLSLQEGFNVGYLDGFKLGEHFGILKGVINCKSELNLPFDEANKEGDGLSSEACVICLEENAKASATKNSSFENLEDLIKLQQSHSNEIIKTLKKSDVKPYFDKG